MTTSYTNTPKKALDNGHDRFLGYILVSQLETVKAVNTIDKQVILSLL